MLPTHKSYITVIHSFGKYLLSIFNVASACLDTTHYLSFLFKVSTAFSRTVPILRSTSQRCVSCDCNLFHHSARLATSGCCKTSHDCRSHESRKWILVWCDVIWNPVEANHTAFRFLFKASSLLCHLIYGSELYSQVCNMLPPDPKRLWGVMLSPLWWEAQDAVICPSFWRVLGDLPPCLDHWILKHFANVEASQSL